MSFLKVVETIREELDSSPFINEVSYGSLFELDLDKQTIFPLAHVSIDNVIHNYETQIYSVNLLIMDIVDISKESNIDNIYGNDNTMYIWNTLLPVITNVLKRFQDNTYNFQLGGVPNIEPFKDRFDNLLAGWSVQFNIEVANEIC